MKPRFSDKIMGQRYETVFCIFLLVLVFLYRENSFLVYPQILYLLASLLILNFAAGWALRRWDRQLPVAVAAVIGNCAVITSILSYSGGPESVFWVLYLLPIYTVCLLLEGMHLILIVSGIIGFNVLFEALYTDRIYSSVMIFNVGLKAGLFVFASAATWKIAQKERRGLATLSLQRTEMDEMEDQIKLQKGSLQEFEKMTDIEQLASGIAHDLKNPVTVIFGTAKMMLEDPSVTPFKPDVERIVRAAELCSLITSNILSIGKPKTQMDGSCDLNEVTASALQIYEPMLQQAGIHVEAEYEPNLPFISGNRVLLERVLLNLMSNARGAMKEGGTLHLKTRESTPASGMSWVQVVVEDTGPGLTPEVLAKIFKPFNTTKAPGEGTGLGLYLGQQIAEKHHGRLSVENRVEGGARFTLAIPKN